MIWQDFYPYSDFIWLPVALLILHKGQRLWAIGFFILCFSMMRLLIELMESIGYPRGILPLLDAPLFLRGLITYSIFYVLYILMAYFSPGGYRSVFIAASISTFILASITAAVIMAL